MSRKYMCMVNERMRMEYERKECIKHWYNTAYSLVTPKTTHQLIKHLVIALELALLIGTSTGYGLK